MKYIYSVILTLSLTLFFSNVSIAQTINEDECYNVLSQLSIPLIYVECEGGKEPTGEIIYGPKTETSQPMKIEGEKVPSSVKVIISGKEVYNSGNYVKDISGATIKIRGNSTAFGDAKPYKLKMQKKVNMLFFGDDSYYKDKDWVLLKMSDKDLRTPIGFKVSELLGQEYTPAFRIVNLFLNGTYRGVYTLCENIKRSDTHRINIDKDGFIIECDPYYFAEPLYFRTKAYLPWTFKYPDAEDIDEMYVEEVKNDVESMEESIMSGTYEDKIDVDSYVRWIYGHDLLGTLDYGGSNMYVTKKNPNAKFCMGPLWDFDTIMYLENVFNSHHGANVIMYPYFFFIDNKTFLLRYIDMVESRTDYIVSQLLNWLDNNATTQEYKDLDVSRQWDAKKWGYDKVDVSSSIKQAHDYFQRRAVWLKNAANGLIPTGLNSVLEDEAYPAKRIRHNLQGTRSTNADRIYIENGKKYIKARSNE